MRFILFFLLLGTALRLSAQQPAPDKTYKLFFEKAYLHTDREAYAAGEDIWFKAYLVNGQTNQLINSSNNLYVELISADAAMIDRKVIRLDNGLGNGDFHLSDSMAAGSYRIRAYTNWMRNFGDNFVFEKILKVYNQAEPTASNKIIAVSRYKKVNEKFTDAAINVSEQKIKRIQFYPEGGSMIAGVAGIVAFKAEDERGNGISVSGVIETATGSLVAALSTSNGFGAVMLNPAYGVKYIAKGNYADGKSFSVVLPEPLIKGLAIHVRNADSLMTVTLSTNRETLTELNEKKLLLAIKSKGKTYYAGTVVLNELQTSVSVPKDNIPVGIASVTLYDQTGKPHCERLVYIGGSNPIKIQLIPDKAAYQSKEKVNVIIKTTGSNGSPLKASLSLAAVDAKTVVGNTSHIQSYLQLSSEVKGYINRPEQYFDHSNSDRFKELDLLLLTQGWRDYTWRRLADSSFKIMYAVEQGITVSGRVRQIWADKPLPNIHIDLQAFGAKGNKMYTTRTDSLGRYYLDNIPLYGRQFIKVHAVTAMSKSRGILQDDSITHNPMSVFPILYPIPKDTTQIDASTDLLVLQQKRRLQRISDTIQLGEVNINGNKAAKLIKSHQEYFMTEKFTKSYSNLMEFLLAEPDYCQLFPGDGETNLWLGEVDANGRPRPARFITKGNKTKPGHLNQVLYLEMGKVEKVVIERALTKGSIAGTVYLTVRPDAFETDLSLKYLYVNGYYNSRSFYTPKYETPSTKPDLRTTIHWEPNITTNEKGEATVTWYNADPKTKVRIVAEGVTANGQPVAAATTYEVK